MSVSTDSPLRSPRLGSASFTITIAHPETFTSLYPALGRVITRFDRSAPSGAECIFDAIKMTDTIRVALDWTPNTLHTGLYLAQHSSFFSSASLDVKLLPPSSDYDTTPARLVSSGKADLAICPSDSCIAYATSSRSELELQAIYAICQRDASAIVSTSSKFKNLKDLEGGLYGSYNARFEDATVRAMVSHAGGDGTKMEVEGAKGKLSLFEEVKKGGVDATWVFMPWEGVEARREGRELNVFRPGELGVPYGYSPVIARDAGQTGLSDDVLGRFVKAVAKGYEYALEHPAEAAKIMAKYVPDKDVDFLKESQEEINGYYKTTSSSPIGRMERDKWEKWLGWLSEQKLLAEDVKLDDLFTNAYFD